MLVRLQVVFLCLSFYGRQWVHADCDADEQSAADRVLQDGPALARTTVEHLIYEDGFRVTCAIVLENWTRFNLTHPEIRMNHGEITLSPPALIESSYRDVMVTRKHGGTATGTSGTVSWLVEGLNRRVFVMWSAPFNFLFYSNWLGVGLSVPGYVGHPGGDDTFDQMYSHGDSDDIKFERHEFKDNSDTFRFGDAQLELVGTMVDSHETSVKVVLRAVNRADLAQDIQDQLCDPIVG